jgi:putative SOS response-associated peptidase YedK
MCGRFILLTDLATIVTRFAVEGSDLTALPGGDLHPGREIPAVVREGGNRLVALRWGLIPAWAKDPAIGRRLFNARAETLAQKPSFRDAFRRRRCLIPADGFYEWTGEPGHKRPVRFHLRSGEPFAFAGLYETWQPPAGEPLRTCTIVTTTPNALVAPIHDRMPVILAPEAEALWLDPALRDPGVLQPLLAPYPAGAMEVMGEPLPFRGDR